MYGDNANDAALKASWDSFCDELKNASDLVFRDTAPATDIDRAKGFRLLARNISLGLQFHLENSDPNCPELLHYFDPIRKQGGDNPDALYLGAPINGEHTYRICGHRGTARYFAVTVLEDGDTPWGGAVIGSLIDAEVQVDEKGYFELYVGPEERAGNFIRTTPGAWRITFRQFFADWENEVPMQARIDCLSDVAHTPVLTPQRVQQGLADTAAWVKASTVYWANMLDNWKQRPNDFVSYRQLDDRAIDATPGGEPLICFWQVPKGEALIVRVYPPCASYWAVECGNYWWESMDYRYHLCSTNCHHAQLQPDGELILVIAHDDPGVANWLDPSGHVEGYMALRWMGADAYPQPRCLQVKREQLEASLPCDIRTLTPAQRERQLSGRRSGIIKRFGC